MNRGLTNANWLNRAYIGLLNPVLRGQSYRGMGKRIKELQRLERMSLGENQERQWQAISRLLQHAYDSTPFYRERLELAGANPADIRTFEGLAENPDCLRATTFATI